MMIANQDSWVINKLEALPTDDPNKLEALLTDDPRVTIYNRHMFIVQATGNNPMNCISSWLSKVSQTETDQTNIDLN
jgi:hypothetical protein